jgi:hypothetical protein
MVGRQMVWIWGSVESSHECWLGACRRLAEVRVDFPPAIWARFTAWVESICTRVRQLEALCYKVTLAAA